MIVLGVPMYNFDVPSTLKAYFDHIARAGVTFSYTAQGPGRPAHRQESLRVRGARRHLCRQPHDTQTAYLKNFLGLLGITDIEFVYAEGLAISAESKQAALAQAKQAVARLHGSALPLAA